MRFLYLTSLSTHLSIGLMGFAYFLFCWFSLFVFLSYLSRHLSANKNSFIPNYTCILSSYSVIKDWTDCMHSFNSFPATLPLAIGYDSLHTPYMFNSNFSLILKKSCTYCFFIYNSILSLYLSMHYRTFYLSWRPYGRPYWAYYFDYTMFDWFYSTFLSTFAVFYLVTYDEFYGSFCPWLFPIFNLKLKKNAQIKRFACLNEKSHESNMKKLKI